ncbi:MAG: SusD/RagB family nutrient-binding outer membrane lipoprotein, partial [Chitinophagaceae bacterium]
MAISNLPLFVAAETNFLLAEASLRGWNIGKYNAGAEAYYKSGIDASMEQWKVTIPTDYYSNPSYLKADFKDPVLAARDI